MSYVQFISDEDFKRIVTDVIQIGRTGKVKASEEFERNVIDPFSMLMEMASFKMGYSEWVESERIRQAQKTLSASIGLLHQKILGSVEGWQDLKTGGIADLVCESRSIIAEVKNKHNTVKGSDKVGVYKHLEDLVMPKNSKYKGYTAYYVEIIPSSPNALGYDQPFTPSDNKKGIKCEPNPKIIKIDGKRFYHLVTGHEDAIAQILQALPKVIKSCEPDLPPISEIEAAEYFRKAFVPKSQSSSRRTVRSKLK